MLNANSGVSPWLWAIDIGLPLRAEDVEGDALPVEKGLEFFRCSGTHVVRKFAGPVVDAFDAERRTASWSAVATPNGRRATSII
jgi:hypothetical protein